MSKNKNKSKISVQDYKKRFIIFSAIAVLISFIYSLWLRWVGDDIFIGLRYVQNFLDGNGLVYNVGERVEGYTDFLWIMIISFFTWMKLDQLFIVQALGILSSIGTLILFSIITWKTTYPKNIFIVPFIALALALNYDYNVWATGGLETSFFGFLLSAAFYVYFFSSLNENKRKLLTGLFLSLAMLTRPDAILIFALSNFLFLFQQISNSINIKKIITRVFLFNLAFLLIYIPYFIWRYQYYGFFFPNTYYVKLGNESLFGKGFYYLWLYFGIHFVSLLAVILPLFVIKTFLKKKILKSAETPEIKNLNAAFITALSLMYVYLIGFVAKVGGDFMQARFVIPMAPFICFIIYVSLLKLLSEKKLNAIIIVLLFLSFIETKIRLDVFQNRDAKGNPVRALNRDVADERDFYVNYAPEIGIDLGKAINKAFEGIEAKLLIEAGQACFGYYANFNYCQELHGLTDTAIAHSTIIKRGRIGHEKEGSLEYLQNKGIHFLFYSKLKSGDPFRNATIFLHSFNLNLDMSIVTYNNDIMKKLKERFGSGIQYTEFPSYLDDYLKNKLQLSSKENLKKDYTNFYLYYFKHNIDTVRENKFLNILGNYRYNENEIKIIQ